MTSHARFERICVASDAGTRHAESPTPGSPLLERPGIAVRPAPEMTLPSAVAQRRRLQEAGVGFVVVGDGVHGSSIYKYGRHMLDTSDPLDPVEVGTFDTAPYGDGAGFGGAWSNSPSFESGAIVVTSMQEGLFILEKRTRPII